MVLGALSGLMINQSGLQGRAQALILAPPSSVFRLAACPRINVLNDNRLQ